MSASDKETGVAGVSLQIDGTPYGTAAISSPYRFTVNTAQFANGTHSLTVSAWDLANNTANAGPISVSFSNSVPGNPGQMGVWSALIPLPIVSVHSVLLPGGNPLRILL